MSTIDIFTGMYSRLLYAEYLLYIILLILRNIHYRRIRSIRSTECTTPKYEVLVLLRTPYIIRSIIYVYTYVV